MRESSQFKSNQTTKRPQQCKHIRCCAQKPRNASHIALRSLRRIAWKHSDPLDKFGMNPTSTKPALSTCIGNLNIESKPFAWWRQTLEQDENRIRTRPDRETSASRGSMSEFLRGHHRNHHRNHHIHHCKNLHWNHQGIISLLPPRPTTNFKQTGWNSNAIATTNTAIKPTTLRIPNSRCTKHWRREAANQKPSVRPNTTSNKQDGYRMRTRQHEPRTRNATLDRRLLDAKPRRTEATSANRCNIY